MLTFRNAELEDLSHILVIERACFPKEEAAEKSSLEERIKVFPKGFLIAELDHQIIGFINGAATSRIRIIDEMFESMEEHHHDKEKNIAIYGVDIHPKYQGKGYSRLMMAEYIKRARNDNREKIILTCKKHLLEYYSSYGYVSYGVSESNHGGAQWFDMIMDLN